MQKTAEQLNKQTNDKIPVCPKCKEEINYLQYSSTIEETGTYDIKHGYDKDYGNVCQIKFQCPDCGEELFNDEEDAYNFLNI